MLYYNEKQSFACSIRSKYFSKITYKMSFHPEYFYKNDEHEHKKKHGRIYLVQKQKNFFSMQVED